jgi:LEA14-like dessication related protein
MFAKARARTTMLVAAAAVMVAAGCASVGKTMFKEPVVTLKDVKLNGLGLSGGSLDVVLNVYNPNGFNLDATRMTYKLMIDTIPFGTGLVEQRFAVAKNDSNTVRIPIDFTYAGIGEAGRQLIQTGTVNYRVTGDVTVGTPLGNYTVPYDRTGRFSALTGRR